MAKLKVGILISGRGSNMAALIKAAQAPGYPAEIACVVSNVADATGVAIARDAGCATAVIPHKSFPDRETFDRAVSAELEKHGVGLVALAGFMRILSPGFVQRFAGQLLNIHPSLLPKYKGLDTHARAIAAQDMHHGASVHYVTAELDGGPVIMQGRLRLGPGDTPDSVSARVHALEHIIYPHVCSLIAAGRVQCRNGTVYFDGEPLATPLLEENDAAA